MKQILVLGDVMLDEYIEGRVDRISPEAPVPIFLTSSKKVCLGGAANVAANIMSLGGQCALIGVTGQDEAGILFRELLTKIGINYFGLGSSRRPTTVKSRFVAHGQQIMRVDREDSQPVNSGNEYLLLHNVEKLIWDTSVLVISDYAKGVLTDRLLRTVIAAAREIGIPVIVDPKSKTFNRYARATVLKPNASELQAATGIDTSTDDGCVNACLSVFGLLDIKYILVTRAEKGMSLIGRDGTMDHFRSTSQKVFDVIGAGDTALAALAVAIEKGCSIQKAASVANVAAGIVVGKQGTATVTKEELLDDFVPA